MNPGTIGKDVLLILKIRIQKIYSDENFFSLSSIGPYDSLLSKG